MLALYGTADTYINAAGVDPHLYWVLGAAAVGAGSIALIGWRRGWQNRRALLQLWPVAGLLTTLVVGLVEPEVSREFPGIITITFAYVGLTCPRWRSLALVPLAIAAFAVSLGESSPATVPKIVGAAAMWVLVAEVPAWLVSRLVMQSELLGILAQTDTLTQLLNRSTLEAQLSIHAGRSAVVLIDLDDFKAYNDSRGHRAGDELLIGFADALRASVRQQDMAFRIGGDEFLLLLVDADRAEAERVIERLREQWAQAGDLIGFSAGIAAGERDLLRVADDDLYLQKRSRDRHPD